MIVPVWYQDASRKVGILVCNPENGIGDFQESDAGSVWVEVAEVRVYSYYFSPNDLFEVFEIQILILKESLNEAIERTLMTGDFNSKSPVWGKACLNRKGILIGDMVARNDLNVLNKDREMTFSRGTGVSITDYTIAARRLALRIYDWCVFEAFLR